MAQAPNYTPSEDFSQDELNNAGGRSTVNTAALDAEFSAISSSYNALNSNVKLNQRDDGEIRDGRVKLFTLSTDIQKLLGGMFSGTVRGAWLTATAYALKDVVTQSSNTYICAVAHTSGVFATDLAAVRWVLVQLGSATAASGTPFTPTATIAATNVQSAIDEADTENRALSATVASNLATFSGRFLDNVSAANAAGMVAFNKLLAYGAGTVGAALLAFGSTGSALDGAGLVAFSPAFANTYSTASVGARVNKAGHSSNTNVIVGFGVADDHLLTGTVGYRSTIVGVGAGAAIQSAVTAGGSNAFYGFGSGAANTEGSGNCFFGALSASANTLGDHNNGFGYRTLDKHVTGAQNDVFGFEGMFSLTSGNNNCGFGESVLFSMTSGNGNVAMGMNALYSKTTGDFSIAIGFQSSFAQTTATQNTAIGKEALYNFTTQGGNTAVGYEVLRGVAGGINNTAMGAQALTAINGGTFNTAVGWNAGLRLTTAGSCVFVGQQAGAFVTTGDENILIGPSAGSGIVAGVKNVAIGSGTTTTNRSNTIALGYNAQPNGDNQVVLGDTNINAIRAQVTTITALSDLRDKKDIGSLDSLMPESFFDDLVPATYRWNMRDGTDRGDALQVGVIAQHLLSAQEKHGMHCLQLVNQTDPDRMEATPGNLLMPTVLEVHRLRRRVKTLESQMAELLAA
jgi:hypothetical protein